MKNTPQIQNIPIDRIRVVNPRTRDQKKFESVVLSISTLGLKRPITVTQEKTSDSGEVSYNLVCGQGRLEAYIALGETHIPALVRDYSLNEAMLAGLVENIARRRVRPLDQVRLIHWMKSQGDGEDVIAQRTGLSQEYVVQILNMLNKGEDRLLEAVLRGEVPVTVAIQIAGCSDEDAQRVLTEAYTRNDMNSRSVVALKRIMSCRRLYGPAYGSRPSGGTRRTSAQSLVAAYKNETQRQRILVRKSKVCEVRLLSICAAFRVLIDDDDFRNLLRAEKMDTMPKFIAERSRATA